MPMPTSKKQYIKFAGAVVGVFIVLFLVVTIVSAFLVDESEIANDQATQAAQDIIQEVEIPLEFLQNGPLQEFTPYEPLEAPENAGRPNPFSPAQPEPEQTGPAQ